MTNIDLKHRPYSLYTSVVMEVILKVTNSYTAVPAILGLSVQMLPFQGNFKITLESNNY